MSLSSLFGAFRTTKSKRFPFNLHHMKMHKTHTRRRSRFLSSRSHKNSPVESLFQPSSITCKYKQNTHKHRVAHDLITVRKGLVCGWASPPLDVCPLHRMIDPSDVKSVFDRLLLTAAILHSPETPRFKNKR